MKKICFLFFLIPLFSFSQIKIDLREKSVVDINGDLHFQNENFAYDGYKIYKSKPENNKYDEYHTHILEIGCPVLVTYKKQNKLVAANYSGELFFYDIPTGKLERTISFNNLGTAMLKTTGFNKNSIITSLSLTDDEQFLIIKTFNFKSTDDKFIDYYTLDISEQLSKTNKIVALYSLYAFPKKGLLNEFKILNTNPKFLQDKAISKIQELTNSKKRFKMSKRYDGIYFTADNYVPLKFIELGDKKHFDAINFFSSSSFTINNGISNLNEFLETISNNNLLSDVIQNPQGTFALFGTSYGSKNNAVLVKIDDLTNNVDGLYNKSILDIKDYFKQNIISNRINFIEYKKDNLYIVNEDNKYYFISPWINQNVRCDKPKYIWGNSYEWKYFKGIDEVNNLNLNFPILINSGELGKYKFVGLNLNTLNIYNLNLNSITYFENPLTESQLTFQKSLLTNINFDNILPVNNNSETVLENRPSKDLGETSCEVCRGTGFIPDKVKNGYVRSFQVNPLNGGLVKCFNCSGKGKYTLVSGEYERKKIIQFDKWLPKNVNVCNSNRINITFQCNKRTFIQESKGGYLIKGELSSDEKLFYSFTLDLNGKVLSSNYLDASKMENCREYSSIFSGN